MYGDGRATASGAFRDTQAAARDGVTIKMTDSYGSFDRQVEAGRAQGRPVLPVRPRRLAPRPQRLPRFGFHEDVPGGPWHWTYRPS